MLMDQTGHRAEIERHILANFFPQDVRPCAASEPICLSSVHVALHKDETRAWENRDESKTHQGLSNATVQSLRLLCKGFRSATGAPGTSTQILLQSTFMGWFSTSAPEQPAPVSRQSRTKCWESRDAYFACLDGAGVVKAGEEGKACVAQVAQYEENCAKSWVRVLHIESKILTHAIAKD